MKTGLNVVSLVPEHGTRRHPLLFVHGAWHGAWCWERWLPWFGERGWECHAVDLRFHGDSTGEGSLRRSRIKHYMADLATVVESLDEPPIMVAHSMGALAAQRLMETTTLPGALLVNPVPIGGVTMATFRVARRHPLKFTKANLTWSLGPLVEDPDVAADLLLSDDSSPDEVGRVAERVQPESYLAYLDMMFVTRPRPQLVDTPVRILAGDADRIFGLGSLRRTARAYGVELEVVPGAAHDLMLGPRWEEGARAAAGLLEEF